MGLEPDAPDGTWRIWPTRLGPGCLVLGDWVAPRLYPSRLSLAEPQRGEPLSAGADDIGTEASVGARHHDPRMGGQCQEQVQRLGLLGREAAGQAAHP